MTRSAAVPQTFALETYVLRSYNYLDRMVDRNGLPYFDVFATDPAEAAHDYCDFGDLTSRQWQAAVMARRMTGVEARNEKHWAQNALSYIDPRTGLTGIPKTPYLRELGDPDDQSLILYALATAYADQKAATVGRAQTVVLRQTIDKMIERMPSVSPRTGLIRGFAIKSLMTCVRLLDSKPALEQAKDLVHLVFEENPLFTPDNRFVTGRRNGHMHGNLRALEGAADYALYVKDPVLFSRIDALYRYVRSRGTRFGFLPEVVGRKGDVISCETCALMDFVGLGVTLANNGHPEYWGDVERMVRNQLLESQVADASWMEKGDAEKGTGTFSRNGPAGASQKRSLSPFPPDTDQFTWRDVGQRMLGGYAGWSSPTHILAAKEYLPWGGPELRSKPRAFQNCCGGSGTHGFFIAWKNSARFDNGTLWVHMHFDKLLPEAEIRCYQPYRGLLTIELKRPCKIRVRIPDFVQPGEIAARSSAGKVETKVYGNYLLLGDRQAGEKLEVTYPLPLSEETETIGNPGRRQYEYRVTWKGDTVVRMTPVGEGVKAATGYSDFNRKEVEIFYGEPGPGRLYQREQMLAPAEPQLAPLHLDDGSLDFWWLH
jgi:hypothetical protein